MPEWTTGGRRDRHPTTFGQSLKTLLGGTQDLLQNRASHSPEIVGNECRVVASRLVPRIIASSRSIGDPVGRMEKNMTDSSLLGLKRLAAGASIVGVLATGGLGVASATAAPHTGLARHASLVAEGTQMGATITINLAGRATPAAPTHDLVSTVDAATQKRIPIGPVIDWIKRNASWIIDALKKALANGWNAFKAWWDGLPSWIRWAIDFLASGTLWDLFIALRHYFLGW